MRATRSVALGMVLSCAAGCYSYRPIERAALVPGTDVRVEMTRVGFASLPQIPNQPGPALAGKVVSSQTETMLLRVPVLIRRDGQVAGTVEQDLTIPFEQMLGLERRALDRVRTGIAVLGLVGGVVGLYLGFGSGGPPSGEEPPPPPDEEAPGFARIELFSLPVPPFGR